MSMERVVCSVLFPLIAVTLSAGVASAEDRSAEPYGGQVSENLAKLDNDSPTGRAGAAEALGFLRAYAAEGALVRRLQDKSVDVRRQAAMALAWCGGRAAVPPLLDALDDRDWAVRQGARVSLTNLTGMEFPLDALASSSEQAARAKVWRDWWATVPPDRPPKEVLELLVGYEKCAGRSATASTAYKGPADVLIDGRIGPAYWQTRSVDPPQWCTIDLGRTVDVSRVTVHQYADHLVMTEYELATSPDGETFEVAEHEKGRTPVKLVVEFPTRKARFVRVTSFGSVNPAYPSTFFEIEIDAAGQAGNEFDDPIEWRLERGLRALGALGGRGATEAVLEVLGDAPPTEPAYRPMVRAGIRSLGRLRDQRAFDALIGYLDNTMWARSAADALGDFGDRRAVGPLLDAYPKFAKQLDGKYPPQLPEDDNWGGPPSDVAEDRMLETPYWISYALCRLPLKDPGDRGRLRQLAPLIMANLPRDHDRAMLYQPAAPAMLTRRLMEASGLRQEACEYAFTLLGRPRRVPKPAECPQWPVPPGYPEQGAEEREAICASTWLPALCTEANDVPRLIGLLEHEEGLARINAAKTLAWLGDRRAVEPIARLLAGAKAEADFGYCGTFKFDEYNDPTPRWREAFVRALGLLGGQQHTALLVRILNDDRSSLGVRYAAAHALGDFVADGPSVGHVSNVPGTIKSCPVAHVSNVPGTIKSCPTGPNPEAVGALTEAAAGHVFESVRHLARDTLRREGIRQPKVADRSAIRSLDRGAIHDSSPSDQLEALVFLKGDNLMHNDVGTVELADRWRRTYVYSDPGPTYRPAQNVHVLRPPRPDGQVSPLTPFSDGYVADPEISWDATEMIFSRRGQDDPWWHVWRVKLDGSGLEQITEGPHHDVGPAYLADGRIVFSSTRSGIRDEYHGYQCNALYVMNRDGTGMERIATNAGRDNEPSVLADGRIAFCRLEMFYARIKTELTLHAVHSDGTQDVVLYGPARRDYWHGLDYGPRSRLGQVENPTMFGVLRMTQPQAMPDGRRIVVATQAGLALVGGRRDGEEIVTPDNKTRVYTTPFPLPDGRLLCASAPKEFDREKIDLGLYLVDPVTQDVELIYNDPATADFEARPVLARRPPMVQSGRTNPNAYSGRFVCESVFTTQEAEVVQRGRLIRLIEGMPVVGRHSTHTNAWPIWKNHHGLFARVLGTFPLAADGSFSVEVPADRLMHFQVLDSDRRVVGNQLTWIYPRGGETKSCVGCHENPHTTTRGKNPLALRTKPAEFLPNGDEFNYRAKSWMKGYLPPEVEERMRTVRAVNLLGR